MKIYKYYFENKIMMPKGAQILTIQQQGKETCVWAIVEPLNNPEKREFTIIGTGWDGVDFTNLKYITTLQDAGGALIWHYFEVLQ